MSEATEVTLNKYHIHVTSSDSLGLNMIENIIKLANMGATLLPGTLPTMRFPHGCSMLLEAEVPPVPNATMRVFEFDTCKEVFAAFIEPVAKTFSMDSEEVVVVDKSTNAGVPWTKEQLDAMDWETEFKEVCKSVDITGRSRDKMTKEYLAKFV